MNSQNTQKFIMITNEFGFDLIIADTTKSNGLVITDNPAQAEIWSLDDKNSLVKLNYWKAVTGYKGLRFEEIN